MVEKEQSVAWSVPYFIPGGTEFTTAAQPPMSVRGIPFKQYALHECSNQGYIMSVLTLSLQNSPYANLRYTIQRDCQEFNQCMLCSLVFASCAYEEVCNPNPNPYRRPTKKMKCRIL